MNRKLILDIVMGSVIPILILNNLNEQLGTGTTYVVAALVPVAWIFVDLCFITKRFNFITSYIGTFAIMRGLLAFWFVDGVQFALKDSMGSIFTVLVFGGSIIIHKPIIYYFLMQGMNPESSQQEQALKALLKEPRVYRTLVKGTKLLVIVEVLIGVANFLFNLQIVVADFGTVMFNQQVAQVNAITRIVLTIPEFTGVGVAAMSIRRAMFYHLPKENNKDHDESDFWDLLKLRESQKAAELISPPTKDSEEIQ
ncbi:mfs transporter [Leptolyngbya sp. Heron Island J]|uniref:VC0807 family protein n=1 Tax=Leptolyngbya sp. Heron Island J TaxID=1385935 RepID=UPI0003B9F569|nr:VC0807 family protein [Leptolyngbya sp. Heron Island J]ESA32064.1 mfs transporter [Leptolyngbya sp. Heron Island J]